MSKFKPGKFRKSLADRNRLTVLDINYACACQLSSKAYSDQLDDGSSRFEIDICMIFILSIE